MAETFIVVVVIFFVLGCVSIFMSFVVDKPHEYDLLPAKEKLSTHSFDLIIADDLLE